MPLDLHARRGYFEQYPPVIDLIEAGDCWEWKGARSTHGYGILSIENRQHYAHRTIWETLVGPIGDGLEIDHLCRNRLCVNPDHLELVTRAENVMRGYSPHAKNARKNRCPYGHNLFGENVRVVNDGHRQCRTCARDRARDAYRSKES